MTKTIYLAAAESSAKKRVIAVGLIDALQARGLNVAIFRPIVKALDNDRLAASVLAACGLEQQLAHALGSTYDQVAQDLDAVIADLELKMGTLRQRYDAVVIIGSSFTDVADPVEVSLNARIAANLDAPAVIIVSGRKKDAAHTVQSARYTVNEFRAWHNTVLGVIATRVEPSMLDEVVAGLGVFNDMFTAAIPENPQIDQQANLDELLARLDEPHQQIRTHARFEYDIAEAAASNLMTVVLPESEDPRVLRAAAIVHQRGLAKLVLLGERDQVLEDAQNLGVDLAGVEIISLTDPERLERYASTYAELRASKGVTLEDARTKMNNGAYFGTMMVKLGDADAMVSGAAHTTADTIRPSFEVIKTKPGVSVVSGAFFMCMADRVLLFADCAVNLNPTPSQLADIAISSAQSAAAFGITPRIAMLSYSTGTSGAGPDVEAVVEATRLVRERRPDLMVEGPIQFDAAVDPETAALKLPDSPVAGQATVFIFPDLNSGNIAYKAVQRSSGAAAIGPILQGLNKTVTDLSRGATVEDIVSTIAITAVQAQADAQ